MPLRDDLLTPIPGDDPAGPYLRYDPLYDKIKDARRDDPLLDPPVKADWRVVADLTQDALAKKSKDLQLAAWLVEAQLNREGFAGLRESLQLIYDLLDKFWDHIHPIIEDGDADMRAAPLGFIASYLDLAVRLAPITAKGYSTADLAESRSVPSEDEAAADNAAAERRAQLLEEGKLSPEEFEEGFATTQKPWFKQVVADIDACQELVKKLEKLGDEKLGDAAPSYRKLREALNEARVQAGGLLARKLELDPDPVSEEPELDAMAAAGGDGTISIEPQSRNDAASRIAAAARYLRRETPTDPAPYLLLRGFRWGELRATPDLEPRMLAAPPTQTRTRLKSMLLDAKWSELLDACEEVMATPFGRGWLDLQRYVLTACEGLGAEYAAVAVSIQGALRSLLRDIPALLDATLMDDSPTGNAETRGWLRDRGIVGGSDADDEEPIEVTPTLSAVDRTVAGLRGTQPQRAIELLLRAATQEKSERAKFLRRMDASDLMVSNGLEPVALPILNELIEQVEKHQLEEWEAGDTVARALGLLYLCMTKLDQDPDTREALYLRVCRLDPIQAMDFLSAAQSAAASDDESTA